MMEKISIVTPSFNQVSYIEDSIRSVLDQTDPCFEHVVVDGGSQDGTLDVLERYEHLSWISEDDRGQAHAVNKGLGIISGDIVGWLNSDDIYLPGAFSRVRSAFQRESSLGVVYGWAAIIDGKGAETGLIRPSAWDLEGYIRQRHSHVPHPAVFFLRSLLDKVGVVDESLECALDYDFLIRIRRAANAELVPTPLAAFRHLPSSKSMALAREMRKESRDVSRRYLTNDGPLRLAFEDAKWGLRGWLAQARNQRI